METPRHSRTAEKPLHKAQPRLSRQKTGSTRRNQARTLLAKQHPNVRRQRQDVHQTVALSLVRQYDTSSLEDLRVATMVRNRQLAKSSSDARWSQCRTTLAYTAACAGQQVIVVAPQSTSQECSACGERVENSRSVRTHTGPCCGLIADREHHGALNV